MIKNLQSFINNVVLEEVQRNKIRKMISEEFIRQLNEKKKNPNSLKTGEKGKRKSKGTKEIEVQKFYNDDMTNGAELARKVCPNNWKDSTKRSYVSKLWGKNKNPRQATKKDIEKGHNAID